MRKNRKISSIISIVLVLSLPVMAFAHSGNTDANGGHRDNKNKSGLGSYHYHCGGHPPHLHTNGVCPYSGAASTSSSSSSSKSSAKSPATVTAKHKNLTDTLYIEVIPIEVESIELTVSDDIKINDDGQYKLSKDSQMQIKAEIKPANATYKNIEWKVNDEDIASIDKNGLLTAYKNGTVIVTATAQNGVTEKIGIKIYSDMSGAAAGGAGIAVLGGATAGFFYKKKKNKQGEYISIE